LVVNLKQERSRRNEVKKLSVTPIGTCRINTPLKRAQSRFPVEINLARNYGFTHTSDEALQQLRYLQGDKQFRGEVRPIAFRPDSGRAIDFEVWQPSNLHIVEISSAKKVTSGPDSVQINYLYRHFADFFANSARTTKFWSLVKRGARADLAEFLRGEPTYRMMTAEDRALLTSLRMEQQDFAAIKADMTEIANRLGRDTLLFVTHVNAQTPDGSTIPARERVISWVKLAAEQLDVPCFDPTHAMSEFGQERAMDQGGLDLTHYTPAFSDRVYAELHNKHVGRLMELDSGECGEQGGAARQQMLADNIDALMQFDDFQAGARRLFAALRKEPNAAPLIQLRGRVLAGLGDFEGAVRDLANLDRAASLSPEARVALLEAFTGVEDWEPALELAEGLLGDEYESRTIYRCAATASEQLGRTDAALNHWKQAFRHDRSDLHAALKGLSLLSQLNLADQLGAWREEVLEHGSLSANGAFEIGRWALDNRDEELMSKVFGAIVELDFNRAEVLFNGIVSTEMYTAAASCLVLLARSDNPRHARQREQLIIRTSKLAAELLTNGAAKAAYELADAVLKVKADRLADRTRRAAENHFRRAIRQAYRDKNYQAAVDAWMDASAIVCRAADTALIVALSLHKLERNVEAIELLMRAREMAPADVAVIRWLGRIAYLLGRYEIALPSYAALRRSTDPAVAAYVAEIERFFATADRRALKQLREAILAGEFELAIELGELLRDDIGDPVRLAMELNRLNRMLRIQLREIEKGDAEEDERERVLSLLLTMHPDDAPILRRAALEMMRQMRFREAAELWARLDGIAPPTESNLRNLERCRVLAARQEKSATAGKLAMAQ
jgi:tetratricopeptide (TPR) repeat protein